MVTKFYEEKILIDYINAYLRQLVPRTETEKPYVLWISLPGAMREGTQRRRTCFQTVFISLEQHEIEVAGSC